MARAPALFADRMSSFYRHDKIDSTRDIPRPVNVPKLMPPAQEAPFNNQTARALGSMLKDDVRSRR